MAVGRLSKAVVFNRRTGAALSNVLKKRVRETQQYKFDNVVSHHIKR